MTMCYWFFGYAIYSEHSSNSVASKSNRMRLHAGLPDAQHYCSPPPGDTPSLSVLEVEEKAVRKLITYCWDQQCASCMSQVKLVVDGRVVVICEKEIVLSEINE